VLLAVVAGLFGLACGGTKAGPVVTAKTSEFLGVAAGTSSGYRLTMSIPVASAATVPSGAAKVMRQVAALAPVEFNITLTPLVFGAGPTVFTGYFSQEAGTIHGLGVDPSSGIAYAVDAVISNGQVAGHLTVTVNPGQVHSFPLVAYELGLFTVVPYCGHFGTGGAVSGAGPFCLLVDGAGGVLGVSALGTLRGTVNLDRSLAVDIHDLDTQATIGTVSGFLDATDAAGAWQLASAAGDCASHPTLCGGWTSSAAGCDFSHVAGLSFAGFTTGGTPAGGILYFTLGAGTAGVISAEGGFATLPSSASNVYGLFPSSAFDYGTGIITLSAAANSSGRLALTGTVIDGAIVDGTYHYDESGGLQYHLTGAWYAYPSSAPIQGYCGNLVAADSTVLGQLYLYVGSGTVVGQAYPAAGVSRPSARLPALLVGPVGGTLPLALQQFDGTYRSHVGAIAVTTFTPGSKMAGTWSDGGAGITASTWSLTRCTP
jgi:hypothetical protein